MPPAQRAIAGVDLDAQLDANRGAISGGHALQLGPASRPAEEQTSHVYGWAEK